LLPISMNHQCENFISQFGSSFTGKKIELTVFMELSISGLRLRNEDCLMRLLRSFSAVGSYEVLFVGVNVGVCSSWYFSLMPLVECL
jgi:hypothetical protein